MMWYAKHWCLSKSFSWRLLVWFSTHHMVSEILDARLGPCWQYSRQLTNVPKINWLEVAALQHLCQIPKTYQLACAITSDEVANIQKSIFLATKSRSEEVTACLQLVKFSSWHLNLRPWTVASNQTLDSILCQNQWGFQVVKRFGTAKRLLTLVGTKPPDLRMDQAWWGWNPK